MIGNASDLLEHSVTFTFHNKPPSTCESLSDHSSVRSPIRMNSSDREVTSFHPTRESQTCFFLYICPSSMINFIKPLEHALTFSLSSLNTLSTPTVVVFIILYTHHPPSIRPTCFDQIRETLRACDFQQYVNFPTRQTNPLLKPPSPDFIILTEIQ